MMIRLCILLVWPFGVFAEGLLDGRVFEGAIGPVENPDLADSLHFENGHFWSDICTRCGFEPGPYSADVSAEGVVFRGQLVSAERGTFTYEGLARADGSMGVAIRWERKRWYWTARREIAFRGRDAGAVPLSLDAIKAKMKEMDPGANPLCARF
ncbi:MAG: hypothetical protein OIF48_06425 [Silicimonas sp.]|nr:hypothetical protein [Silicimonas sp.]